MTTYKQRYARTDDEGNLVIPIEAVNLADLKTTGSRCLDSKGRVDDAHFAKKLFGTHYKKVEFEKGMPLEIAYKKVEGSKVVKDRVKNKKDKEKKEERRKMAIEADWMTTIKDSIDFSVKFDDWLIAEKKVYGGIWPSPKEFEEYDKEFRHKSE